MRSTILGIGTALPSGSLTQDEAAEAAHALRRIDDDRESKRTGLLIRGLYRRSAVSKRHSVLLKSGEGDAISRQDFFEATTNRSDKGPGTEARMKRYDREAPKLAHEACRIALEESQLKASEIQHLVTVSCSGFSAPGFDLKLFESLGLNSETSRTHVGFMGCHAALNGLRVASALAMANPNDRILVCATELCTLHHQFSDDPQQMVANSLFADGAAAMVVVNSQHFSGLVREATILSDSEALKSVSPSWQVIEQMSSLMPATNDMMTWSIADSGFQMTLSPQVPEAIEQNLKPWLECWLARHDLTIDSVDHWAVHPGGPRILSATAAAIGIERDTLSVSYEVLSDCGNMSSPTILFILKRLADADIKGTCVALGFGPGLVAEAALLKR